MTRKEQSIAIGGALKEAFKIHKDEKTLRDISVTRERQLLRAVAKKYKVTYQHIYKMVNQ